MFIYNPFKFVDTVRTGNKVRIKININGISGIMSLQELNVRIDNLREEGFDDFDLKEELKAKSEYFRERQRDKWPSQIY
jgi:hypothetical protein